jgi:hypothetical protein
MNTPADLTQHLPKGQLTQTPEGTVYEVFGHFREDGMHHLGSVIALNDELAKVYADKLYDEWSWSELAIIRRDRIKVIIATE